MTPRDDHLEYLRNAIRRIHEIEVAHEMHGCALWSKSAKEFRKSIDPELMKSEVERLEKRDGLIN